MRVFVDQGDGDYFADALCCLYVDYAFAGAVGEAVFVGGRALAVSVFGYGENQSSFLRQVDNFGRIALYSAAETAAAAVSTSSSPERGAPTGAAPGFGVTVMPTT